MGDKNTPFICTCSDPVSEFPTKWESPVNIVLFFLLFFIQPLSGRLRPRVGLSLCGCRSLPGSPVFEGGQREYMVTWLPVVSRVNAALMWPWTNNFSYNSSNQAEKPLVSFLSTLQFNERSCFPNNPARCLPVHLWTNCLVQEFSWLKDVFSFVSQTLCPVLPESTVGRESPNHFWTRIGLRIEGVKLHYLWSCHSWWRRCVSGVSTHQLSLSVVERIQEHMCVKHTLPVSYKWELTFFHYFYYYIFLIMQILEVCMYKCIF